MESEFISDQKGGAKVLKFTGLSNKELQQRFWSFPEARAEYLKRFGEKITRSQAK